MMKRLETGSTLNFINVCTCGLFCAGRLLALHGYQYRIQISRQWSRQPIFTELGKRKFVITSKKRDPG